MIDKLKDPYFITDLVRQEYGLSYQGELIFNIPLQENFLQAAIKSIMDGNLEKIEDNNGRIDDSKIPELAKKDDKKSTKAEDSKTTDKKTNDTKKTSDTKKSEDRSSDKDEEVANNNEQNQTQAQRATNRNSNTNNRRSNG